MKDDLCWRRDFDRENKVFVTCSSSGHSGEGKWYIPAQQQQALLRPACGPFNVTTYTMCIKPGTKAGLPFRSVCWLFVFVPQGVGLTVTANLDDTIIHKDELHVIVTEGDNRVVGLTARGIGPTVW